MKAARGWFSLAGAAGVALLLAVLGGCANPSGPSTSPVEVYQGTTRLTGSSFDFGSVTTFSSGTLTTFTITNTGSATITLSGIDLGGADSTDFKFPIGIIVEVAGPPVVPTIAPGQSYTFNLSFAPSKIGAESATVTVNTDQGSATFSLSGTGAASGQATFDYLNGAGSPVAMAASGTTVQFSYMASGNPAGSVQFQINNPGGTDLGVSAATLSNVSAGDSWTTSLSSSAIVAAGSFSTFYVYVNYTDAASSATVTIKTSDSNNPTLTFTVADPLT